MPGLTSSEKGKTAQEKAIILIWFVILKMFIFNSIVSEARRVINSPFTLGFGRKESGDNHFTTLIFLFTMIPSCVIYFFRTNLEPIAGLLNFLQVEGDVDAIALGFISNLIQISFFPFWAPYYTFLYCVEWTFSSGTYEGLRPSIFKNSFLQTYPLFFFSAIGMMDKTVSPEVFFQKASIFDFFFSTNAFLPLDIFSSFSGSLHFTWSGLLLSVLTTYLYFLIATYYFPVSNNFVLFPAFVFFMVISEVSLYLTFLTSNFFIFYILFEFILVPFYFIVLLWGSRANRVGASFRLVFFTLVFSLPLTVLVALNLYNNYFSFNFDILFSTLSANSLFLQVAFYFACFLAFAVKIPLFPAHVWLPEAHGEAPTFGSVLLAGILLKLGGYGFYQVFYEFVNPSWNMNLINLFSIVYVISVLTIFYSNIVVFNQLDIKRTIAYYSIGHMGFVTLGLISGNQEAMIGAVLIMLSHGLSAAGLFFCVGYIYEQSHTRSIIAFRGLATHAPYLAIIMFFFVCANISFPGTSNFIGEQLVLVGLAKLTPILTFLPMFGVFFGGLSTFLFYIRIVFGEFQEKSVIVRDLNTWQLVCLSLVFLPLVVVGFFPSTVVDTLTSLF